MSRYVSPSDFGGQPGSGIDDFAAIQAAMALDAPLYLDGVYCSSQAAVYSGSNSKVVSGDGHISSSLKMTSATQDGFVKAGPGSLILEGIGISTAVDKSSGAAVVVKGSGGRSQIQNCMICGTDGSHRLSVGIDCRDEIIPVVRDCYILTCHKIGLSISSAGVQGAEDFISNVTFNTLDPHGSGGIAILLAGSFGPTRISNCLFQNYDYGILDQPPSGFTTHELIVEGSAFAANYSGGVVASLPAGSNALMQTLLVEGNVFSESHGPALAALGPSNTSWIDDIIFSGNKVAFAASGTVNVQAGRNFHEGPNLYRAVAGGLTAIVVGPSRPIAGHIGTPFNGFIGVATRYALNGNTGFTKVTTAAA